MSRAAKSSNWALRLGDLSNPLNFWFPVTDDWCSRSFIPIPSSMPPLSPQIKFSCSRNSLLSLTTSLLEPSLHFGPDLCLIFLPPVLHLATFRPELVSLPDPSSVQKYLWAIPPDGREVRWWELGLVFNLWIKTDLENCLCGWTEWEFCEVILWTSHFISLRFLVYSHIESLLPDAFYFQSSVSRVAIDFWLRTEKSDHLQFALRTPIPRYFWHISSFLPLNSPTQLLMTKFLLSKNSSLL